MNAQTLPRSRFGFVTPLEEPPSLLDIAELQARIGQLERDISQFRKETAKQVKPAAPRVVRLKGRRVNLGRTGFD